MYSDLKYNEVTAFYKLSNPNFFPVRRDKWINMERKKKCLVEGGKKVGGMGKEVSETETVEECEEGEG